MKYKCFISKHRLPQYYKASTRPNYVLSSVKNHTKIINVLQNIVPFEIADIIVRMIYTKDEACFCEYEYTCALCSFACCRRAYRQCCTCSISIKCDRHGYKCYGLH